MYELHKMVARGHSCLIITVIMLSAVSAFKIIDFNDIHDSSKTPYKFYDRESWDALPPQNPKSLKTPVPYVVIHHTYIPGACYNFTQCAKDMRSMQNYHMSQGWGDIGYNFCVGAEGSAYEGRGWHTVGIHARQANGVSIGICLIGDWREQLPPNETLTTTKALIQEGVEKGVISSEYKLIGHQQVNPTDCPGKKLLEEISTWPHYQPGPFPG